jgi:hypothetical protein
MAKKAAYRQFSRITRAMMAREEEAVYHARGKGALVQRRERPKLIDLFCGAGGMTLGFTKLCGHNFQPVWANDNNSYAVRTYNANFGPHCIEGDINDILEDSTFEVPGADVVISGPPCFYNSNGILLDERGSIPAYCATSSSRHRNTDQLSDVARQ